AFAIEIVDAVAVALFLASYYAIYLDGAALVVDGGLIM
ncbi:MAG: hypothetical protein HW403_203, partial [Dehalococcoidia bacterium]|nr:hypothetical protein [Dehalococcoidia bacterium]